MKSRLRPRGVIASLASAFLLAACGGGGSDAPASDATDIPAGAALSIVDYPNPQFKTQFELSGQQEEAEFSLTWVTAQTALEVPRMLQLGQADVAWVPEGVPALAGVGPNAFDIKVVALTENVGTNEYLMASPTSGIAEIADLKGKKVGVPKGTVFEALVAALLDAEGMTLSDIEAVDIPTVNLVNNLVSGNIDAAPLVSTLRFVYSALEPEAVEVATTKGISTNQGYLLASDDALADAGKAAAIRDLIRRLAASSTWIEENTDAYIEAYFTDLLNAPPGVGEQVIKNQGVATWVPVTDDRIAKLQAFADLEAEVGLIPEKVDVTDQFDTTFDDALKGDN